MNLVYNRAELADRLKTKIEYLQAKADQYRKMSKAVVDVISDSNLDDGTLYGCMRTSGAQNLAWEYDRAALEAEAPITLLKETLAHLPQTDNVELTLEDVNKLGLR